MQNVKNLKQHYTMFSENERIYILNALKCVHEARVSSGMGMLDFEPDMEEIKPHIFVVNEDGHTQGKEDLCKKRGVQYHVLKRLPAAGLPVRSSSSSKKELQFPFRICVCGGWIDQPWVSEIHAGSMLVASLVPNYPFNDRSGMATSTRKTAIGIWANNLPSGNPDKLARILFGAENPPGTKYVAGSQDSIGLCYPGISRLHYRGEYWPSSIDNTVDEECCAWLESVLHLVPIGERPDGYDPLITKNLDKEWIQKLGTTGDMCWEAIHNQDVAMLGRALNLTTECWRHILPETIPPFVENKLNNHAQYPGCVPSGCGGGYLIIASEEPIPNSLKITIRRV